MISFIKKFRKNPKRTVITFSFQKKMIINRLGDLIQKNDNEMIEEYKQSELKDEGRGAFAGGDSYVLEGCNRTNCGNKENPLKEKRKQIEAEQAQILEKDNHERAFKENYHISPLDFGENDSKSADDKALGRKKDMRGGIVCEKSFRILLCDMLTVLGVVFFAFCVLFKSKATRK